MARLVGMHGVARSGKDTCAEALVADGWVREAFADRMRAAMLALDPWVDRFPRDPIRLSRLVAREGWEVAKTDYPEVRRLLQKFGTEAGRDIHGDQCWIKLVLNPWAAARDVDGIHTDLVVTDARFSNECQAIRDAGGIVIHVVRPGQELLTGAAGAHASEKGVDPALIDVRIENDGTIADLHRKIRQVVRNLLPE